MQEALVEGEHHSCGPIKFQQNVKMLSIQLIKSQFPIYNLDLKKVCL